MVSSSTSTNTRWGCLQRINGECLYDGRHNHPARQSVPSTYKVPPSAPPPSRKGYPSIARFCGKRSSSSCCFFPLTSEILDCMPSVSPDTAKAIILDYIVTYTTLQYNSDTLTQLIFATGQPRTPTEHQVSIIDSNSFALREDFVRVLGQRTAGSLRRSCAPYQNEMPVTFVSLSEGRIFAKDSIRRLHPKRGTQMAYMRREDNVFPTNLMP